MTLSGSAKCSVDLGKGYQMPEQHKNRNRAGLLAVCLLYSAVAWSQPKQQQVVLHEQSESGAYRIATLIYHVTENEPTTGIGFRIHFDSDKVKIMNIESHLKLSNVGIQIMADMDDLDADPDTDSYINAAWVDLSGNWPAATHLPARLYSFTFDAVAAETSELFTIYQSSLPVGYDFASTISSSATDARRSAMRGRP